MHEAGLAEVAAAKADGRWEAAYESQRLAEVPADLAAALETNKTAKATFDRMGRSERYLVIMALLKARTAATRQRVLEPVDRAAGRAKSRPHFRTTVLICPCARRRADPDSDPGRGVAGGVPIRFHRPVGRRPRGPDRDEQERPVRPLRIHGSTPVAAAPAGAGAIRRQRRPAGAVRASWRAAGPRGFRQLAPVVERRPRRRLHLRCRRRRNSTIVRANYAMPWCSPSGTGSSCWPPSPARR